MLGRMGSKTERFRRLLDTRVRTVVLVVMTVLFLGGAILIGLPPQSGVPDDPGRMLVLPDLPADAPTSGQQVGLGWLALPQGSRTSASLVWALSDVDLYVAVDATSVVAQVLRECAAKPEPGSQDPSLVSPVRELPERLKSLLEVFDEQDYGGVRSHTYFKLAHTDTSSFGYLSGSCAVDPAYTLTKDTVELHFRAPEIMVVAPKAALSGDNGIKVRSLVSLGPLPSGWSVQDQRAAFGTRREGTDSMGWDGANVAERGFGQPWNVGVVAVGPAIIEASSLNEARRGERALFWAGLLVGLAGSCLLMLFEALPWRRSAKQ